MEESVSNFIKTASLIATQGKLRLRVLKKLAIIQEKVSTQFK